LEHQAVVTNLKLHNRPGITPPKNHLAKLFFDISRQAVSLHVNKLEECGVLSIDHEGSHHRCNVRQEKLAEVSEWLGAIPENVRRPL